ncbi:GNAT family N-acetyltransferase [Jatrophihabitans sp.]|uniref:GNAT family N-acetyltransferase n=1 Tax=Jatrophihabitans sp. TaxID=1932789 RepID=UPI0030C6B6B1|nr:GCN5-related N-acetyltransferase [Jatrophihabitans sp.]
MTTPLTDASTVLVGRTVRLRAWREDDIEQVFQACQDVEIQRWTRVPVPYARDDATAFVGLCPERFAAGVPGFAITAQDDVTVLGSMGFVGPPHEGGVEFGYWIAPWARGRGVAGEATALLCDWAFDVAGLARIEWMALVGNDPSRRVAERSGFQLEGTLRGRADNRGVRADLWIAGLLRDDPRPWHAAT